MKLPVGGLTKVRGFFFLIFSSLPILCGVGPQPKYLNAEQSEQSDAKRNVQIKFDLPDNVKFIEKLSLTEEMIGLEKPITGTTVTEARYSIRKTAEGYAVKLEPVVKSQFRGQADVTRITSWMVANANVIYDLNPNGRLLRVRGHEAFAESLEQILPRELLGNFLSATGVEGGSIPSFLAQQWNNRMMLGMFVGQTVTLGEVYESRGALPMPGGGTAESIRTIKFDGPVACGRTTCLHLHISFYSDKNNAGEKLTSAIRSVLASVLASLDSSGVKLPEFRYSEAEIKADYERLFDPSTGLIFGEKSTVVVSMEFERPKESTSRFQIKRVQSYEYTYQ